MDWGSVKGYIISWLDWAAKYARDDPYDFVSRRKYSESCWKAFLRGFFEPLSPFLHFLPPLLCSIYDVASIIYN